MVLCGNECFINAPFLKELRIKCNIFLIIIMCQLNIIEM